MPGHHDEAVGAANRSRASSSRCSPATPTSSMRSTPAPWTATVSAASAATGASEVPALITATSPRRDRQRTQGHGARHLVDDGVGQLGADEVRRLGGEPGREHGPFGVPLVQRAEDPDDLLGRLAGAVDDLRVAGSRRPVDVDPGVAEVGGARVGGVAGGVGHRPKLSVARRSAHSGLVAGVRRRAGTAW